MNKIKVRQYSQFGLALLVFIVMLVGLRLLFDERIKNTEYRASIKIDAVREDDEEDHFTLEVIKTKEGAKIISSNYDKPIYAHGGKIILDSGGKFKYAQVNSTFDDGIKILNKLVTDKKIVEDGNEYICNPLIEAETIDEVLQMVLINRKTTEDVHAHIIGNKKKIKSFTLYLTDIEGYKGINIAMSFDEIQKGYSNKLPNFYDEVMERVEFADIAMIK